MTVPSTSSEPPTPDTPTPAPAAVPVDDTGHEDLADDQHPATVDTKQADAEPKQPANPVYDTTEAGERPEGAPVDEYAGDDDSAIGVAEVPDSDVPDSPHPADAREHDEPTGPVDEPGAADESRAGTYRAAGATPDPALFPAEQAAEFRRRWQEAQVAFVDDPAAAVDSARRLLTAAVDTLDESLRVADTGTDTELLRLRMRRYHTALDQLTAL